ncbi:MAG: nucleoside monophosphate kinase [Candidatus Paceibacterota bacterium]|jgi:adenylate kinase
MNSETFVFFGQVGSGKGTQVKLLMDLLKSTNNKEIIYAGTGEGFRKLINSNNYAGNIVKDFILKGQLVPDFLTNAVFTEMLISTISPEKHLIADGYPRTVAQAEIFQQMMEFFKRENVKIIYIELSEIEAMKRNLLRGRADDTEAGLKKRFDEYKNNVIPAMNYFKDKKGYQIYKINGEQSIEAVHADIVKALGY